MEIVLCERSKVAQRAVMVADAVFALAEPWRSRFVALIAHYATDDGVVEVPTRDKVIIWLMDEDLNERIRLMLRSWTGSG